MYSCHFCSLSCCLLQCPRLILAFSSLPLWHCGIFPFCFSFYFSLFDAFFLLAYILFKQTTIIIGMCAHSLAICAYLPFVTKSIYHLLAWYWLHQGRNILLPRRWYPFCWSWKDWLCQCWCTLSLSNDHHCLLHLFHLILRHFH